MSVRRELDRSHLDCQEYTEKFYALWEEYDKLEKQLIEKYPTSQGLDHPAAAEVRELKTRYIEKMKKLQEEYAHLFYDEVDG